MARLEGHVVLPLRRLGALRRTPDRGGPSTVPVVIQERHGADERDRLTLDGAAGIAEVWNDADINRGIVHVVLDAFAVHELQPERAAAELDVRAEIDAPPCRA